LRSYPKKVKQKKTMVKSYKKDQVLGQSTGEGERRKKGKKGRKKAFQRGNGGAMDKRSPGPNNFSRKKRAASRTNTSALWGKGEEGKVEKRKGAVIEKVCS